MNTKVGARSRIFLSGRVHWLEGNSETINRTWVNQILNDVLGGCECSFDHPARLFDIVLDFEDGDREYLSVRRTNFRRDEWGDAKSSLFIVFASMMESFGVTVETFTIREMKTLIKHRDRLLKAVEEDLL